MTQTLYLTLLHQVLTAATSQETAHHIIQMFFTKIDAVRFAEDFNDLPQRQKSAWLDRAYMQQFPSTYGGLTDAQKKAAMDEDGPQVIAWKRQIGRVSTARNRLLALFREVSTFNAFTGGAHLNPNPQYGAMVILDPVWNLTSLQTNAGGELFKVIMSLSPKLTGLRGRDGHSRPHPLTFLQPAVEHALVCIVESVAGIDAAQYMNDFLDEYAPQMRIPRDPVFDGCGSVHSSGV